MRSTRGRRREYVSATHKKRAFRQRQSVGRVDGRVRITPLGYLYLRAGSQDMAEQLWSQMGEIERKVLTILCASDMTAEDLSFGLTKLFGKGLS